MLNRSGRPLANDRVSFGCMDVVNFAADVEFYAEPRSDDIEVHHAFLRATETAVRPIHGIDLIQLDFGVGNAENRSQFGPRHVDRFLLR